jgi:hypothetical protein
MDDKQFEELGSLIAETLDESTPDISRTLGNHHGEILFEFIALLLWIVAKEAQTILPKKLIQPTIDTIFTGTFLLLGENANFLKIFNEKTWEGFIQGRFEIYYRAWHAFPIEDEQVSKITVAHNFILCCLTENEDLTIAGEEYSKFFPNPEDRAAHLRCVFNHYRRFSEKAKSILSRLSSQVPALTQGNNEDYPIDFVAAELKKDINYLVGLGIKLDKGKLTARTGGAAWAGYEAFTGDWLSALVIGGISLLVGGLTNGYKRIKLMKMKQKWMDGLSGLNQEQLNYLAAGLQRKYPLLLGQFQNLLQAGQG